MGRFIHGKHLAEEERPMGGVLGGQGSGTQEWRSGSQLPVHYPPHISPPGVHEVDEIINHILRNPAREMIGQESIKAPFRETSLDQAPQGLEITDSDGGFLKKRNERIEGLS